MTQEQVALWGLIFTGVQALVVSFSLPFLLWQLREMKRTNTATGLMAAFSYLGDEKVREARRVLVSLSKPNLDDWTQDERTAATLACNAFDMVGILVSHGVIPATAITTEYRGSIIRCWENGKPLRDWNSEHSHVNYWDDFGELYKVATSRRPRWKIWRRDGA